MPEIFSFLQHPMILCLRHIPSILKNIDMVQVFYYNTDKHALEGKYVEIDDGYQQIIDIDFLPFISKINEYRDGKQASWHAQEELGFKNQNEKGRQLAIQHEDKIKILKLCYENETDNKRDIIFIYFNSLSNVFPNQISNDKKKLSTSDKSIIQNILQSSLTKFLDNEKKNKEIYDVVNQNDANINNENEKHKKEIIMIENRYGDFLISFCMKYLKELEALDKNFSQYIFNEDCFEKIKTYNGKFEDLKKIITNAIIHAANKTPNSENRELIIYARSLNFDIIPDKISAELKEKGFDEYDGNQYYKAISLLNKYESAVLLLIEDGKKVTITSVGENCKPFKVTGAAVSDAIKTYIEDFKKLFEKYPDKWQNIKKLLKPIATRIVNSKLSYSKQA